MSRDVIRFGVAAIALAAFTSHPALAYEIEVSGRVGDAPTGLDAGPAPDSPWLARLTIDAGADDALPGDANRGEYLGAVFEAVFTVGGLGPGGSGQLDFRAPVPGRLAIDVSLGRILIDGELEGPPVGPASPLAFSLSLTDATGRVLMGDAIPDPFVLAAFEDWVDRSGRLVFFDPAVGPQDDPPGIPLLVDAIRVVPEPTPAVLLGLGLAALAGRRSIA